MKVIKIIKKKVIYDDSQVVVFIKYTPKVKRGWNKYLILKHKIIPGFTRVFGKVKSEKQAREKLKKILRMI